MGLLWKPDSWEQRLAELQADSGELKEAPLRRDVRSLGTLLGEVLREQAGDELFEQVEELRLGTIQRREAEAKADGQSAAMSAAIHAAHALAMIHKLPVERALLLTRAFGFYFELINLAETNHRKRRRLALQLSGAAEKQRGSLAGTLGAMQRVGISAEEALVELRKVLIVPVFTAHPTEVARRSVMFKRRRIGELLEALDRIPLPNEDLARLEEAVRAEITSLWQTDEVRSRRPTVYDEIKMGLDYYDVSIFATLPSLYREIGHALYSAYGIELEMHDLPQVLAFGSWIGGDRDGNPFVTPDVTRNAIQLAREHLLHFYDGCFQTVIDLLSTSAQQMPVTPELKDRLAEYESRIHTAESQNVAQYFEFELYRRFLICIRARLRRTLHTGGVLAAPLTRPSTQSEAQEMLAQVLPAYASATEFRADLEMLRDSLAGNRGLRIARNLIDPLVLLARTFGLHLHTLDIRQHAKVHAAALKETIADACGGSLPGSLSAETQSVLETFRVVAEAKAGRTPE
ncbi:MAG TPA: phosphoenolpyruvate carboxylase, partial [Acidobacteriaceae bacterium]